MNPQMIPWTQVCSYAFQWRCDAWDVSFFCDSFENPLPTTTNFAFGKDTFFKQEGVGIVFFTDLAFPCSLWSTWLCNVEFAVFFFIKTLQNLFFAKLQLCCFPWNSAARSPLHLCAIALAGHPVPDLRHVWKLKKSDSHSTFLFENNTS